MPLNRSCTPCVCVCLCSVFSPLGSLMQPRKKERKKERERESRVAARHFRPQSSILRASFSPFSIPARVEQAKTTTGLALMIQCTHPPPPWLPPLLVAEFKRCCAARDDESSTSELCFGEGDSWFGEGVVERCGYRGWMVCVQLSPSERLSTDGRNFRISMVFLIMEF